MTPETPAPPPRPWIDLGGGVSLDAHGRLPGIDEILPSEALSLVARLHRELDPERRALLDARRERQAAWDAGGLPGYLDRGSVAATGDWRVAPIPTDLVRRRVEITGPVNNAKMVVQMLSRNDAGARADTAMLDFEDSMKPTWRNVVDGLRNVRDAARGTLSFVKPAGADGAERVAEKVYGLDPADMAVIMVRVRGLHLRESNLRVDGEPISGGLLDLVLTLFHGARPLLEQGKTPTLYVPKVEHHLEARWWNRLFVAAQEALGLPVGTLRATFLIETLPAAFQMEEILYEVRDHAAGLNVGRWDKIFSDIKAVGEHPDRVMADRASIGMDRPWMRDYARRLVEICHRRGAAAIGGMAAFTPGRSAERRAEQTAKVVADKEAEATAGHDGCWVSHPYFIGPALSAFRRDHQRDVVTPGYDKYPDLLPQGTGPRTLEGLRKNVRVGIAYLRGWQADLGCVAWDDLMEDLATLEISRAQTWQWLRHRIRLDDGGEVDPASVRSTFAGELERILTEVPADEHAAYRRAAATAEEIFTRPRLDPFLAEESEPA